MHKTPGQWFGLPGLACLALAAGANAQSPQPPQPRNGLTHYRVEVLVFRNLGTAAENEDPGKPPLPPKPVVEADRYFSTDTGDGDIEASEPVAEEQVLASGDGVIGSLTVEEPSALFFAPVNTFQLDEVAARIRRSRGYRLLLHESWRQPGFPSESTQPVDLLVLEQLRRLGPAGDGTRPPDASSSTQTASDGSVLPPLSGTITLYRSRYLHLSVDLSFLTGKDSRFVISERRRMRSGELHYLDSPGLGVIALVIPITNQPPQDEIEDQADTPPAI